MPDVPDIHDPVPDLGHESLRQSVVAALDGIEEQIGRLERVFLLLKGTGHAMQGTLNVLVGAQATQSQVQQALTAQAEQIAALQAAVDALTPPTPP
jgi:hypothetical protein